MLISFLRNLLRKKKSDSLEGVEMNPYNDMYDLEAKVTLLENKSKALEEKVIELMRKNDELKAYIERFKKRIER
jgi:predicted RNase H-like nuclease (RuvC/YqgF family)